MKRHLAALAGALTLLFAIPPASAGEESAGEKSAHEKSAREEIAPRVGQKSARPAAERVVARPRERGQPGELNLYVGQARVLQAGDVRRIVIGNGKVIQATALDDGQVLVIPEAPGQSTLHTWGKDGSERSFVVTVIAADAARILNEVRAMLGTSTNVGARVVGDKIVVEGANLTEEQAGRLVEVGKRYPQIVNLVSRIGFERMIAIDVRMVEIRRDQLENIGVRWSGSVAGPNFDVVGDLKRSRALEPGGSADGAGGIQARQRVAPFATALSLATSITSMINLMVQNGDAVVLAEPSLSCRSGGSAKFLAGGELPIPYSSGMGAVSVIFKEYGVKFDINPVASETGMIAAKVATEISSINFDVLVKDVPGLTKRRAETEVNLREHETLVIAGLIAEESSRSIDRVPALGTLPVLGSLFRSRAFRDRQSELVVFITPRFVEPLPPQAAGATPNSSALGAPGAQAHGRVGVEHMPGGPASAGAMAVDGPAAGTAATGEGSTEAPHGNGSKVAVNGADDNASTVPAADASWPSRLEADVLWPAPADPPAPAQRAQPQPPPLPPAQRYMPAEIERRAQDARSRVRMLE